MNDLEKDALNWENFLLKFDCAIKFIEKKGYGLISNGPLFKNKDLEYKKFNSFPFSYLLEGSKHCGIPWHERLDIKFNLQPFSSLGFFCGFNRYATSAFHDRISIEEANNIAKGFNIGRFFRSSYIEPDLCIDNSIIPKHLKHIKFFK
jgi:hypothetical protein